MKNKFKKQLKKTKTKYKTKEKKQNPQITYFAQTHIPHIKSKELKQKKGKLKNGNETNYKK